MVGLTRADEGGALFRVDVADSWFARLRGLIGRSDLPIDGGLYLPGTNSIHMLFMRFPIDCVFLGAPRADGTQEVVAVKENLRPWTGVVWWVRGARGAVEVAAGAASAAGLAAGDYIRLEPVA
jgi:uncharacterized membrane protein (UPF0127 family)